MPPFLQMSYDIKSGAAAGWKIVCKPRPAGQKGHDHYFYPPSDVVKLWKTTKNRNITKLRSLKARISM